jgi:hypothetical protein
MRTWRHSGLHAFAGEEIPDISDALRVGLYMVRGPPQPVEDLGDRLAYVANYCHLLSPPRSSLVQKLF